MSHAFEFGTISFLIYFFHKLQVKLDNRITNSSLFVILFFITIGSALVVMVRPTNICMFAISLILLNKTTPVIHTGRLGKVVNYDFLFFITLSFIELCRFGLGICF